MCCAYIISCFPDSVKPFCEMSVGGWFDLIGDEGGVEILVLDAAGDDVGSVGCEQMTVFLVRFGEKDHLAPDVLFDRQKCLSHQLL